MAIDYAALHTEITTDPNGYGYAPLLAIGNDQGIADLLNLVRASITSRLAPTVAGMTLDVSAGGEAGVDWANVGSPTTAQGLSGTTISTSQAVASVSGAVGSVTGAVGSVTGAVGSVTADVGITQTAADKVWSSAARTLTSFGTLVADMAVAVWGAVTRTLTAGTNIVLAKGSGVTGFNDLDAAGVRGAVGMASANLDTQLGDKTGYSLSTTGIDALFTRQLTESYAADGAAPTVAQALMLIQQHLTEFVISGVTWTTRRLDGTTTAATFTLDDATSPTSITRAS